MIRMLKAWNGYPQQAIVSLSGSEETRLVGLGLASFDLDGEADAEFLVKAKTNQLTGMVEISAGQTKIDVAASAQARAAITDINQASIGTLITNWVGATINANGTPVSGGAGVITTDRAPSADAAAAVRLIGDASIRASVQAAIGTVSSAGFRGVCFYARVKGRTAGNTTTQMFIGNDSVFTKSIALTFGIPNDGKWHLLHIPAGSFSAQNGFVLGTDNFTHIKVNDRYGGSIGYPGMLFNTEELQLGPVYINPFSRAKFLIRFDDSLNDCIVPNGTFLADGITKAWSGLDLLTQYGFRDKGSIFHLTRRIGTSNSVKTFLTTNQMSELAAAGWSHCFQSHQDPCDNANNGLRLMGPVGYTAKTVASVDTSANTLTASAAHNISAVGSYWGYPVVFAGTDLPAPLDTSSIYWARYSSATAFTLHPTENDAIAGTNTIDLTTTGAAANFTFRYAYSSNDSTVIQQDFETGIAALTALGYSDTARIYAANQGQFDTYTVAAIRSVGLELCAAIGNTYLSGGTPMTRHPVAETTGLSMGSGQVTDSLVTLPSAIQTDGAPTATDARNYVDYVINMGGVGSNYHHSISASNGPVLAAYLDQLRTRVAEGSCDVVTAAELRDYLKTARSLTRCVVF